jgi:hypothetical protein
MGACSSKKGCNIRSEKEQYFECEKQVARRTNGTLLAKAHVRASGNSKAAKQPYRVDLDNGRLTRKAFSQVQSHGSLDPTPWQKQLEQDEAMSDEPAFFESLSDVSPESLRQAWSKPRCPLPEYRRAAGMICLQPSWLGRTKLSQAEASPDLGLDSVEGARERFEEAMEDFLDDYKRRAFISAFLAPLQCYLNSVGAHEARESLNLHGQNWYLALLQSTIGAMIPIFPDYDDSNGPWSGIADFWSGLNSEAWEFFADERNFGKYAELPQSYLNRRVAVEVEHMPHGYFAGTHVKNFANEAVNPSEQSAERRKQLAKYLERFAYFFRFHFFVRTAFETLSAEAKPEHAGFRKAMETLYANYRLVRLGGDAPESLSEYLYRDEAFTKLDTQKVGFFFAWLGIVRPSRVGAQAPDVASL